jgi:hypothetical protein
MGFSSAFKGLNQQNERAVEIYLSYVIYESDKEEKKLLVNAEWGVVD